MVRTGYDSHNKSFSSKGLKGYGLAGIGITITLNTKEISQENMRKFFYFSPAYYG